MARDPLPDQSAAFHGKRWTIRVSTVEPNARRVRDNEPKFDNDVQIEVAPADEVRALVEALRRIYLTPFDGRHSSVVARIAHEALTEAGFFSHLRAPDPDASDQQRNRMEDS